MIRVIVSGSRYATDTDRYVVAIGDPLLSAVRELHNGDPVVLAHGAARGVDSIAARLAESWRWWVKPVPALWSDCDPAFPYADARCPNRPHRKRNGTYCPYAGRRRNQQLVNLEPRADVVIAFPDQRRESGTRDFLKRAKAAGYDPQVHELTVELP